MRIIATTCCIILSLLSFSCKSKEKRPPPDCSQLKNGRFEYRGPFGEGKVLIERNDSIQVETESITGTAMQFRITWISPCQYDLEFLSASDPEVEKEIRKELPYEMRTTILEVRPNYYIYELEDRKGTTTDTIRIIK